MARQARIVIPHADHHVSQRGQNGERVFFQKEDFQTYLNILQEQCQERVISISGYCLLPNQIHLSLIPTDENGLARAIGETNRRYTRHINERENKEGNLFQSRFFSYTMDKPSLLRAIRFIETLPVTSGLTPKPENYLWSSAKCRIKIVNNPIIQPNLISLGSIHNWSDYLSRPMEPTEMKKIQTHLQTGRPRGTDFFLDSIEDIIGRSVRPQKRGRKPLPKVERFTA